MLAQLFVRAGDRIAAGQRLALLKNDVAEGRVAQAEAALATARATLVQVSRGALPSGLEGAPRVRQARARLRAAAGSAPSGRAGGRPDAGQLN